MSPLSLRAENGSTYSRSGDYGITVISLTLVVIWQRLAYKEVPDSTLCARVG
ncbi:hypothetical protein DL98DRAFT_522562 [Cadophora sp. DSE1049]|nr:hypothetical protein DL98DRAFT_522562 [Cadophora sp. DSE1049]